MRKLGFTLAEVLITLGIIGVIATLTLPTLMANTAEREYSTALKKGVNALTEAVQMQVALENISFDEMIDAGDDNKDNNSLYAYLCNRMQTEKLVELTSTDSCAPGAESATDSSCLNYGGAANSEDAKKPTHAMFFKDGSALLFNPDITIVDNTCTTASGVAVNCFAVIYDVNGFKKPNMVANCLGPQGKSSKDIDFDLNLGGSVTDGTNDAESDKDGDNEEGNAVVCNSSTFNARDQYPILLYSIGAYPGSKAAEYMMNKK